MAEKTFTLDTGHKHALHGLHWPVDAPQAVVGLIHGHGEHIGRYGPVAEVFNQAGIALMGPDLIGHGESPGKRGHFPSYEEVLDGIEALLRRAREAYPEVPRFLMGHSMGGNLVANYVLRRKPELQGVILSAPWFELAFAPTALDLTLARVMKNIFPSFTQSSKLEAEGISRDPQVVAAYRADAKVHDMVSPGLFIPVVAAGQYAITQAGDWPLPVYLYHGDADRITSLQASQRFAQGVADHLITLRIWPGNYHEMHNDLDREAVLSELITWVEGQLHD
jgi:acylglycerol lipase